MSQVSTITFFSLSLCLSLSFAPISPSALALFSLSRSRSTLCLSPSRSHTLTLSRSLAHSLTVSLTHVADVGTGAFSVRQHFQELFEEQGEGRSCLFYNKAHWRRRWETLMTFIVHVNVVLIPFFTTFTSNSALGKENRLRMTPESFQLRSFMQDVMLGVVLISILLFSIDIFFRGNTVTKRSFNEFEVRRTQLWWSYIFSFNGLCDLVAAIAPFISLFAGKKDNRYGDMVSYTNIMWQRGFLFLLFKSRLLFDITFPAHFGVFANRILRLCRMFLLLLVVVHFMTCIWKLTVDVGKVDHPAIMAWDELQYLYIGGISIQDADVWEQYQAISYHVLLLMFGENIDPQTPLESVCAFFIVMTGLVATALVVANMTYYVKMILQDSEAVSFCDDVFILVLEFFFLKSILHTCSIHMVDSFFLLLF